MNIIKSIQAQVVEEPILAGTFHFMLVRDGTVVDEWDQDNLVVTTGLNNFLDVTLGGTTATSTWYIGLYSNNRTVLAADIYTDIGTSFIEITAKYDEATRQTWTKDAVAAAGAMSNSVARATFTFNASEDVWGAMFVSSAVKGDNTSGLMLSASTAGAARAVVSGDELLVQYAFAATSS